MVCKYKYPELNTREMQKLTAYLFPYVVCVSKKNRNSPSSSGDIVESAWFPEFHMTYSGFLFHLQLTWGTPAGKREECSFKGKNLEVSGIFYRSRKTPNNENTQEK